MKLVTPVRAPDRQQGPQAGAPEPSAGSPWSSPWVLVPAAVGIVVALVLWLSGSSQALRVTTPLATVAALGGVGAGAVALVVLLVRRALRRAHSAGVSLGREAEEAVHRQFLARLDHELKNPLTAIHAAVTSVTDVPTGRAAGLGLSPVTVIEAQAARMGRLVGDLRKIAMLESQPVEQEPVDVEVLTADVVAAVQEHLALTPGADGTPGSVREIVVVLPRVPWPLPHVRGDMDLLFVALYNVLSNAVKFTDEGARIEVRGIEEQGTVVLEVADSGAGIPAGEVSVVWHELARGSNASGTQGSGLGLAMVHAIVRRHGGQVFLSSRLGHGTSVRMRLPCAAPAVTPPPVDVS